MGSSLLDNYQSPAQPQNEQRPASSSLLDNYSPSTASYEVPEVPTPLNAKGRIARDLEGIEHNDWGGAMNNALSMGGASLAKAVPKLGRKLGRIVGGALEGGITGAAQAPEGDGLAGFFKGAALQGGLGVAGKALGKGGDIAMQIAVNRRKYTPGVGTQIADEGLWGTQSSMRGQVQDGLTDSYEQMLRSAEGAKPIDSRVIGNQVYDDATNALTGHGTIIPSSSDVPKINQAREFADDIRSRGQVSGPQALKYRAAAGKRAYSEKQESVARETPIGKLSKKEQILYSDALKNADETGKLREADARYGSLKRAERGLEEEMTLPKSVMGAASMGANKLPGGALAASSVGQLGVKGGKLSEFLAPLARQAAVGGSRDQGPSAQELAEYEQYLRETGQK